MARIRRTRRSVMSLLKESTSGRRPVTDPRPNSMQADLRRGCIEGVEGIDAVLRGDDLVGQGAERGTLDICTLELGAVVEGERRGAGAGARGQVVGQLDLLGQGVAGGGAHARRAGDRVVVQVLRGEDL